MPRFLPQITAVDLWLQRRTGGRVSLMGMAGLPGLTLVVTGRRSGQSRSTPLQCLPTDDGWLVVGSHFGLPTHPAWVHNLRAAEQATVQTGRRSVTVTSRELSGAERERAWQRLVSAWPAYAGYQAGTDRRIPIFLLTPAA